MSLCRDLVLATKNSHKILEIKQILEQEIPNFDSKYSLLSSKDVVLAEVVEIGSTFAENALLKARFASESTGQIAIADDSGISVNVLGGSPGIFSARWAGNHGDDIANRNLLLAQLKDIPYENRKASFICAAAFVTPQGCEKVSVGVMRGTLAVAPMGSGGFGYDSVMIPEGKKYSCAQIGSVEKNQISHRYLAFRELALNLSKLH